MKNKSNVQASAHSFCFFLKMVKSLRHFPQPRFQAVGLAIHAVKKKTVGNFHLFVTTVVLKLENFLMDTCPKTHLCLKGE